MLLKDYLSAPKVMGIYCIEHVDSEKKYIGSSVNIKRRLSVHHQCLEKGNHINKYLQNYYNKYKSINFSCYLVEQVNDENLLIAKEQYWINHFKSYDTEFGFNYGECAQNPFLGMHHTEETKQKMRELRYKYNYSPTPKHRETLSRLFKGKKLSEERCEAIRLGATLAHDKEKRFIKLISPSGDVIERTGIRCFCREFKINRRSLQHLLAKKIPHHKGWRVYNENSDIIPMSTKVYVSNETKEKIRAKSLNSHRTKKYWKYIYFLNKNTNIVYKTNYPSRLAKEFGLFSTFFSRLERGLNQKGKHDWEVFHIDKDGTFNFRCVNKVYHKQNRRNI